MTDAGQAYDFRACTPEMIRDHLVSCFEESYSGLLPAKALAELVRSLRSDSLGGMLPNEDERLTVIGDAERIVGSAVWAVRGNMAYIWGFYVRRHAQRAGIGTSLLKRICSEVPAGTILEVTVLKQSESAIAFYRHLGFDLLCETRFEIVRGYDEPAVRMQYVHAPG